MSIVAPPPPPAPVPHDKLGCPDCDSNPQGSYLGRWYCGLCQKAFG